MTSILVTTSRDPIVEESALVAQNGFAERTDDGWLRPPRFLGPRDDKRPVEVVRERPR
jgi:bifunctional non-homologous end joining protein LigD